MPCHHESAAITITIVREIRTVGEQVDYDYPITVKNRVYCPECSLTAVYNANYDDPKQGRRGANAWPVWFINRIRRLALADAYYRKAFVAVHVPGVMS